MTYLITKSEISTWLQLPGTLGSGTDDKKMNRAILEAQNFDLKGAIGYPLFFDLINSYGSESISVAYTNLSFSIFVPGETVTGKNNLGVDIATGIVLSDDLSTVVLSTITGDWNSVVTLLGNDNLALADFASVTYGKYYNLMKGESYMDESSYLVKYEGLIPAIAYWAYSRLMRINSVSVTASGVRSKTAGTSEAVERKQISEDILQLKSGAESYLLDAKKYLNDKNSGTILYPLWGTAAIAKRKGGVRMSAVDRFDTENQISQNSEYRKEAFGGYAGSSANLRVADTVYTTLNVFSYSIPALTGKTIAYVQLGSLMLTPAQYTLVGAIFTIVSTVDDPISVTGGLALIITYQV